jgi:hypothetical protein
VGPVRFSGLRVYTDWDGLVREDQWIKTIATIDAGLRVTLEVPREQGRCAELIVWGDEAWRVRLSDACA